MRLTSLFTVIDSTGERHTVSAWRGMTMRSTSGGIEFVPVIMQYRVDEGQTIERIDDISFRTATGEILRRLPEMREAVTQT